ncbi:MAG: PhoH-like protein [Syntrophaceae bacterium PtaB.Bin038]|nr:MAG: PhoH-like protein [Syntrophaceae bacterium PtaB.Bin038]
MKNEETTKQLTFHDAGALKTLLGGEDRNLRLIETLEPVRITARGDRVTLTGDEHSVDLVETLLGQLYRLIQKGFPVYSTDVGFAHRILSENRSARIEEIFLDKVYISSKKRVITPKSIAQKQYIDAIRRHDMVFGIGPAGTGKTYLAMAMAVSYLMDRRVNRIVLTRPAVEAGEKLGFLPGDLVEKVNPYLRPVYDALYDMMEFDKAQALIEKGIIEVAPLAFMRGRTLNDSFIILDEAQNTTSEQMKMFVTRLGWGSRAVVTGDVTQIDLPSGRTSGLVEVERILSGTEGIRFVYFSEIDVVRHPLVSEIIKAYDHLSRKKAEGTGEESRGQGTGPRRQETKDS